MKRFLMSSIVGALMVLLSPFGIASGSEVFGVEFDRAIVDTGEIHGAEFEGSKVDPVATLQLQESDGFLSGPAEGFGARDWYSGSARPSDIGVKLIAADQIHGGFNSATGSLEFSSEFQIEFFRLSADEPDQRQSCLTESFPITFTSSANSGYHDLPAPFVDGVAGRGSVWGAWSSLPIPAGEGWCEHESFDELVGVGGAGGIMLTRSQAVGVPVPPPDDPPGPQQPSGGPDLKLRIRAIAGNKFNSSRRISVTVLNVGDERAGAVKLCAKSKPTLVRIKKRCRFWKAIGVGAEKRATIRIHPSRPSDWSARLTLRLSVAGKKVSAIQRVLRAR